MGPSDAIPRNRSLFGFCFCFGLCRAIPREGAAETFFKSDLWIVAEEFPGLCDIRLRIADVAVTRRLVFRFEFLTGNFGKQLKSFVQRKTATGPHVEGFAGNVGSFASEEICL